MMRNREDVVENMKRINESGRETQRQDQEHWSQARTRKMTETNVHEMREELHSPNRFHREVSDGYQGRSYTRKIKTVGKFTGNFGHRILHTKTGGHQDERFRVESPYRNGDGYTVENQHDDHHQSEGMFDQHYDHHDNDDAAE